MFSLWELQVVGREPHKPVAHRTRVHTSIPSSTSPVHCIVYRPPTDSIIIPSGLFPANIFRLVEYGNAVIVIAPNFDERIDSILCD